jgi:Lrp/AsnC family leucine-responsive transcriptional regulator
MKTIFTNIDDFDVKILEFLQENAKLTAKEIAAKLSLSQTPIYERIKKLEKLGVIKNYVALLDPELLNKSLIVFMNITIKDHGTKHRNAFINEINALEDVSDFYHTSGAYDYLVKVRFNNMKEYRDFLINHVATTSNIGDIDSQIVLEELKSTTQIYLKSN